MELLTYTEDSGKDSLAILEAWSRRVCRTLDPDCQTQRLHIRAPLGDARRATIANAWFGSTQLTRGLARSILTGLLTEAVVFLHIDADVVWSEKKRSTNLSHIRKKLIPELEKDPRWTRLAANFVVMVPYYSIESWLFLNTAYLTSKDLDLGDALAQAMRDAGHLDNVWRPKEACPFGSAHNYGLASFQYDMASHGRVSPSLGSFLEAARGSPALQQIIERTCQS